MMKKPFLNRRISSRMLSWICVTVFIVSLIPLYTLSFYNHACYDDFGFSVRTHQAWLETGSFLSTVKAAIDNTIGIRNTWEGTYATSFISALQPALFGEELYWIATFVLLTFFLVAVWYFLRQALVHVSAHTFWAIYCALAFVMVQFVPELSEAFFWFNGGVAYTLFWSVILLRIGLWLHCVRTQKLWMWLMLFGLTVAAGGAKYSTVLFAVLVDALFVLSAFISKRRSKWTELVLWFVLMACFVFSMTAPGNGVRAETLMGGMSAPKAVLQAFYFGFALIGDWFSPAVAVVWAFVSWLLADDLQKTAFRFRYPLWVTALCCCLFCAQLAPTLYTGNYIGDGRTVNTYYYTFVLMGSGVSLYWTGWYLHRKERKSVCCSLHIGAVAAAAVIFAVGCAGVGLENLSSVSALRSLVNGDAQTYDQAMRARTAALRDPAQPVVTLERMTVIPEAFMGDALESDNLDYVLHLYAEYYGKQQVYAAGEV